MTTIHNTTIFIYINCRGWRPRQSVNNKLNQLISVEADNGMTASYEYDAMGRRNLKNVNGTETYMYSDGVNVISEVISGTEETGSTINHYYRGKTLVASNTSGTLNRYSYDPHGSVTAINGVEVYSYDAFGNQIADNPAYANPFRYCGEYFDQETGLIYLRARYYDPSIGRFISEDPIKDGLNWYVYCGSDPVNFWDPSGKAWTDEDQNNYNVLIASGYYQQAEKLKETIQIATAHYEKAQREGNYVDMNAAAKQAVNIRKESYYYVYEDTFDYTHGGKIYEYSYTSNVADGYVYIVKMNEEDSLKQTVREQDFVVRDRRDEENPAMEIMDCYKSVGKEQRIAVLNVLATYEKNNQSNWNRDEDIENMEDEWWLHIVLGFGPLKDNGAHAHIDNKRSGVVPMF